MPSIVTDVLFSEPSGRRHALVMFSAATLFVGLYVYYGELGESATLGWLWFLIVGNVLSGVAESLPKDRRQAAGVLRVVAVLVLTCMLGLVWLAPEIVVGPE